MIPALIFMGAGIVGQVMWASFKDSFFADRRLKRAIEEGQRTLNRTDVRM